MAAIPQLALLHCGRDRALARRATLHEAPPKHGCQMKLTRFLSLDVCRGMALCVMIIVNTPGAGAEPYPILDHAPWFGFTLADVVLPSFLFAVGNAMAFGNGKNASEAEFWRKTLRRTVIILALGVLTYWFPLFRLTDHGWVYNPFSEAGGPGGRRRGARGGGGAAGAARGRGGK